MNEQSIKNLSYQQLKEHRRICENALSFALNDYTRKTFGITIEGINAEIDRRHKRTILSMAITVNVLVIATVFSGCHTVNGVGRDLSAWSSPYIEHQEK